MTTIINAPLSVASGVDLLGNDYPNLFVHTRGDKLDLAAPICANEHMGAVICVSPKITRANLANVVARFVHAGANPTGLMLDANRYSGKARSVGADGMNTAWVRAQTNAGIPHPLTNSGYIPDGNHDALRSVLRTSADMGEQVIAALPIANSFLQRDVGVLIEEINAAGVSVALMIEHRKDPFGPRANVAGLLKVLDAARVPVLLLRSDLSVLGALAWGARAGAFGTSTTLRHIYPVTKSGGGRPASISAIVKDSMSLNRLEKIDDAIQRMPDPMWNCPCTICFGRSLNWIATEDEAFQHSLSVVADLSTQVLDNNLSPLQRRRLWRSLCHNAQFRAHEIDAATAGAWGEPPDYLGAWVAQHIDEHATI